MTQIDFDDDIPDLTSNTPAAAKPLRRVRRSCRAQSRRTTFRLRSVSRSRAPSARVAVVSSPTPVAIIGACFNCKGAGKLVYKTSPESRAKSRASSAVRAQDKAKQLHSDIETWKGEHPAAWEWIARQRTVRQRLRSFADDALHKYGSLTDNQLAAVERNVAKAAERKAEREAAAPAVDATKIEQAFAIAREKAARPGMMGTFEKPLKLTSGDVTIAFRPGSIGSQWEGMLFAKTDDGKKVGHIKNGKFFRKFECTDAEAAAVARLRL